MRIAWLNWRDTDHPEGGGSEVYMEQIASGLVDRGHEVTIVCAEHAQAPAHETRDGIRFHRLGSKLGVYSRARRLLRSGALGPLDVIVDTHNGVPFFAPWATRAPVVVLVHHVHREQWPVIYGPVRSRVGWWIESRLSPRVYRDQNYIAVSERTREELVGLGVTPERIRVVHNGVRSQDLTTSPGLPSSRDCSRPTITVLGRLVPHKQIEHVFIAATQLRQDIPDLRVVVIGDGWWAPHLHEISRDLGVGDIVEFTGFVDEGTKDALLRQTSVLALPSLKEGWGLVVMEAAARGVPAVGYAQAGGVAESILHEQTGILAGPGYDVAAFAEALRRLLADDDLRHRLGHHAHERAARFDWQASTAAFEELLLEVASRALRDQRSHPANQFVEP